MIADGPAFCLHFEDLRLWPAATNFVLVRAPEGAGAGRLRDVGIAVRTAGS